jgi:cation:H+ antiporter
VIAYLLCARLIYIDHRAGEPSTEEESDTAQQVPTAIVAYLLCVLVIFLAAPRLATVADQIGEITGISDTFIGASLVGLVTSLPEVVTTIAAIRIGCIEMAVANIFGSNGFNLLILATVDLASPDSLLSIVGDAHLITAGAVILATSATVLGLLYRAEKRFWLIEPDAALVVLLIVSAMILVYYVTEQ